MLENILSELSEILVKGPRVLILGQYYLGETSVKNPLFAAFEQKHPDKTLYDWWLEEGGDIGKRAANLIKIDQTVVINEEHKRLLALPWTAVFTSAIDSLTRRNLEIRDRRQVLQILTPGFNQTAAVADLALFRLFGTIERTIREELPPADRMEIFRRVQATNFMLLPLLQLVTPNGYIFIEGWKPDQDWLSPRELFSALVNFAPGQVLLFGVTAKDRKHLEGDRDFAQLISLDIVRIFEESLVLLLDRIEATGRLRIRSLLEVSDQIFYPLYKSTKTHLIPKTPLDPEKDEIEEVSFSRLEWRNFSQGMEIFSEVDQYSPLPETDEGKYEAFYDFIANGPRPDNRKWLQDFIFQRPVYQNIKQHCLGLCKEKSPQDNVMVLFGQAGSGKTALLNLLALELRRLGLPVILIEHSIIPVKSSLIDEFCEKVSDVSPLPVFILFDGLQKPMEYVNLASYLASRARKCVVVGTAYPAQAAPDVSQKPKPKKKGIHANIYEIPLPVRLEDSEREDFLNHIEKFIPDVRRLAPLAYYELNNFFALIYRLFPPARMRMERSLTNEVVEFSQRVQGVIDDIRAQGLDKPQEGTIMGQLLWEALSKKLGPKLNELFREKIEATSRDKKTYEINDALLLINSVMLVSRSRLELPQSLALRLIRNSIPVYRGTMSGDIVQDKEVRGGIYVLEARLPLEAQIWIEQRLPYYPDQFELIKRIVCTIYPNEVADDTLELDFVVKLLQSIGPQGPELLKMKGYYDKIAGIVEDLHKRYREIHPRLLLLGANAFREWLRTQQFKLQDEKELQKKGEMLHEWLNSLDRAEKMLQDAFEIVKKKAVERLTPAGRRLLATLETERASVLGTKIGTLSRAGEAFYSGFNVDRILEQARNAWRRSLHYDEDNYMALDTACWIYKERFEMGHLEIHQEADDLADWTEVMELYNEIDIPPSQYDERDKRESQLSLFCGDLERFQKVVERIRQRGSFAGDVLTARFVEQMQGNQASRAYLEEQLGDALYTDRNALVCYMRLWWHTETGYGSFFPHERLCLPFRPSQWERLLRLTTSRLQLEENHSTTLFLQASALLHLNRVEEAKRNLAYLDRLGVGGFRRSRALMLMTDESGTPRQFTAIYQGRKRGERFLAWCDDLRTNIDFSPEEHGIFDIRPGIQVGPFHLSIRFRGLFAEPTRRFAMTRKAGKIGG